MFLHFMCQILIQYIASLNRNILQKWGSLYWKRQRNMTLSDVTEQRFAIHFVFALKKTLMQISNILEQAENMFYVNCTLQIYDKRDFWIVEILNRMIVDLRKGGLPAMIRSKEWITSWFPCSYVSRVTQ
jgi:hypothetical protein